MTSEATVTVDLARGEITLGAELVRLERLDGGLRFRLAERGVCAVSFAERSRLVAEALAADDPVTALIGALRDAAAEGDGGALPEAVALALAGGGEDAPAFEECAVEAARRCGWNWAQVSEAPAIEVDRMAARTREEPAAGWKRFVFGPRGGEVEALSREMAERLLARGAERELPSRGRRVVAQPTSEAESVPSDGATRSTTAGAAAAAARVARRSQRRSAEPATITAARAARIGRPVSQTNVEVREGTSAIMSGATAGTADSRARTSAASPVQNAAAPAALRIPLDLSLPSAALRRTASAGTLPASTAPPVADAAPMVTAKERPHAEPPPWPARSGVGEPPVVMQPEALAELDVLDAVARALAAECDLRGIDA